MEKNFEKMLKIMCVETDETPSHVAELIGMTRQNFNRKLRTENLRFTEAVDAMRTMGYAIYAEKDGKRVEFE